MRVMAISFLVVMACVAGGADGAFAQEARTTPIQLSLFHPVQIFPAETSVKGLRLNLIYGVNHDVVGIDLGLVNRVTGMAKGYQGGLVGFCEEGFVGWHNHLINLNRGDFVGLQSGFYSESASGEGIQWGMVNRCRSFSGLMVGFLNMAEQLDGLQIGLINVASKNPSHPVFPIINWRF